MATPEIIELAGAPDVILISADGVKLEAHIQYLSTAGVPFR
jgi:hypothetical protein